MSFALLLLLLSVPIFSLVFLFGGIELDQLATAFLVTAVAALTLGIVGITCSTLFHRTLPATVAAYGAAFILLAGSFLFGLLFPSSIDATASKAPAPPAITYLSPIIPLVTIGMNQPLNGYGIRSGPVYSGGVACSSTNGGPQICYATGPNGAPVGKGFVGAPPNVSVFQAQQTGTTIPSGLFAGWQYWQASIAEWLVVCAIAIAVSAFLLPPVRRFHLSFPRPGGEGPGPPAHASRAERAMRAFEASDGGSHL
jgi:hypothetical protein